MNAFMSKVKSHLVFGAICGGIGFFIGYFTLLSSMSTQTIDSLIIDDPDKCLNKDGGIVKRIDPYSEEGEVGYTWPDDCVEGTIQRK